MKVTKNKIILFYFFLYISLILGFYFNEDFAGGFKDDYNLHHWLIKNLFSESILYGLLNYDIYYVPHSPLFVIYIIYLEKIFNYHEFYKFIHLHLSLLIPLFVGLSLKYRYNLKKLDPKFLIPSILFISPYFRAGSIWVDDNIFSLIFLSLSILFFIKFENSKDKLNNILICTLFLALASYFRPIYSIFSIYFCKNCETRYFNKKRIKEISNSILKEEIGRDLKTSSSPDGKGPAGNIIDAQLVADKEGLYIEDTVDTMSGKEAVYLEDEDKKNTYKEMEEDYIHVFTRNMKNKYINK